MKLHRVIELQRRVRKLPEALWDALVSAGVKAFGRLEGCWCLNPQLNELVEVGIWRLRQWRISIPQGRA